MSFGPDVECGTTCVAGADIELCEAETVDIPAAVVLSGTETDGVPATFCGLETAGVFSSRSDIISSPNIMSRRRGGLMVSALDSGASAPGSSPGLGHCVVFLGKTLYSHGASLHPGV